MVSTLGSWRTALIYLVCLPAAILVGFALSGEITLREVFFLGGVLAVLTLPAVLQWHHMLLILAWNAYVNTPFLPGQPQLWMFFTVLSVGISIAARAMDRQKTMNFVKPVAFPLILLGAIILMTAQMTGGIGFRSFGDSRFGGKLYMSLILSIVGFFPLAAQSIPEEKATRITFLFFVTGVTAAMSNAIYAAGEPFYFLYAIFPPEWAMHHFLADYSVGGELFMRLSGVTPAAISVICAMTVRYGFLGWFDPARPWRVVVLMVLGFASLLGGFRSHLIMLAMLFAFLFYFERLYRTKLLPILLSLSVAGLAVLFLVSDKLPLSAQRVLTVLPVKVDPAARHDAQISTEWRLSMWKVLYPMIPQYLLIGKGLGISPMDLYLTHEATTRGLYQSYEEAIVSGNYHSGPLSVLIPFGIPGSIAFLWFLAASFWALYSNYRYSPASMRTVNTFLLSYFCSRVISFLGIYGALNADMFLFTGTIGLSIALNHGVRRAPPESAPQVEEAAAVGAFHRG